MRPGLSLRWRAWLSPCRLLGLKQTCREAQRQQKAAWGSQAGFVCHSRPTPRERQPGCWGPVGASSALTNCLQVSELCRSQLQRKHNRSNNNSVTQPVTGFLRPPVAKAQVGEVPGGEALAQSSQWEQNHLPWDQDAPLATEPGEGAGVGLLRARDLGSLPNGPTVAERKVCACM